MRKLTYSNIIVCIISGVIIDMGLINNLLGVTVDCGYLSKTFPIIPVGILITLVIVVFITIKSDVFSNNGTIKMAYED